MKLFYQQMIRLTPKLLLRFIVEVRIDVYSVLVRLIRLICLKVRGSGLIETVVGDGVLEMEIWLRRRPLIEA